MVSALTLVPALFALALGALLIAAGTSAAVNKRLTRISRGVFGRFVDDSVERRELLQSAYVPETYRAYAAKTYLYAVVFAVLGGIVGGYLVALLILAVPLIGGLIAGLPNTMTAVLGQPSTWSLELAPNVFLAVAVGGGVIASLVSGALAYTMRWQTLASRAEARRRRINESLARTVAFLYALSRGGMPFPVVMRTLADNRGIYGESAREMSVAVRQMDLFGTDMINAIRRMAKRTPSEEYKTFGENLSSVLQSGQNLPQFLHDQYERYQEEAEDRQEELLELLATIAEAYVTVLVAGTLFLITILLVFGLTTTDTLGILRLLGYLAIPLANVGFIVFLDQRLELLGIGNEGTVVPDASTLVGGGGGVADRDVPAADGGHSNALADNFDRLAVYDRLQRYKRVFTSPVETVLRNPTALLYVTIPLALVVTVVRLPTALTGVGVNVRVLDDLVIQALLFVLSTYAIVRYVQQRRLKRVESASPEMLERLASLNEAGMSVVESFDRIRGSDLGALTPEIERIWTDISLGANVEAALVRFGDRVRTVPVTRAVTLLTNAMRASGNIGAVLRIAATQARADLRMKRQRRRQMLTYLVVIYVAFLVFLVIIVAVEEVLVPSLPNNVPTPPSDNRLGVDASQFTRFGSVDKAAYTLVFFHIGMVQAFFSGLVGGQLGEGSLRDGVKHAAVLLTVAYVVFVLLSSPVASMNMADQFGGTSEVEVESASLSDGGFIVVHRGTPDGEVIGVSEYLPAGTSEDVTIQLDREIDGEETIVLIPHQDTDEDRTYDADNETDTVYPPSVDANQVEFTFD
ncbi:type II secretion system protein [Halorientalis sp. IM1011]|uniref:type II secretion system F family protein n=1 Tax=Halorientalis sp. IM1011 TaxID=1932360 RepID=UPI00097CC7AB|nr:type II secretion system F family protein [Halorientalis sp. IM1011]AQL41326.1 type II secretion system protein [Halorientalis sp. IM1011]